jgi:hypothetical protein
MYTGRSSQGLLSDEWIEKTDAFLELAFAKVKGARATWCPYSRCANTCRQTKDVMGKHFCKFGFTADYTRLRQVADGCAYRVGSFTGYDVNGYHFHTTRHEQSRPNRRTTNTRVFTLDLDGVEYYGRIEEIYEFMFHSCKPLNPVIFKCH